MRGSGSQSEGLQGQIKETSENELHLNGESSVVLPRRGWGEGDGGRGAGGWQT